MNPLRTTTLALLALCSTSAADAIDPIAPVAVASVQDLNLDGLGDVVTPGSTLVQIGPGGEDRAVLEFDLTSTVLTTFTDVGFVVRIQATDSLPLGSRSFDFYLYTADGATTAADFHAGATWIGTASFDPAVDPNLWVSLDVTAEVTALLQSNVTYAGLRVQAASNPSGANVVSLLGTELHFADCPPQLWSPYCFGDGSGANCPCGNVGAAFAGCANSATQGAVLAAQGTPDASGGPQPFQLLASGAPPNKPGMFLSGTAAVGFPAGDGLLCAGGSLQRFELVFTDAAGAAATSVDIAATTGVQSGETRYVQYWFRDPAGPCGGGFNFTNGLQVFWL